MFRKNQLDEMKEMELLKIESRGCWFAFWGLLVVMLVQQFAFGYGFQYFAGEWLLFMILAIYLVISCLKAGIWDRHLKPNLKTNALVSLIGGAVFGFILSANVYMNYKDWQDALITFGVTVFVIFLLCLGSLTLCAMIFRIRHNKLESKEE